MCFKYVEQFIIRNMNTNSHNGSNSPLFVYFIYLVQELVSRC